MNLSQILINAGVTPDDLHSDCRFIAQDNNGRNDIYFYDNFPKLRIAYSVYCSGGNV